MADMVSWMFRGETAAGNRAKELVNQGTAKKSWAELEMAGGDLRIFPDDRDLRARDLVVAESPSAERPRSGNRQVSALRASRAFALDGSPGPSPSNSAAHHRPSAGSRRPSAPSHVSLPAAPPPSPPEWPSDASRSYQCRRPLSRRTATTATPRCLCPAVANNTPNAPRRAKRFLLSTLQLLRETLRPLSKPSLSVIAAHADTV